MFGYSGLKILIEVHSDEEQRLRCGLRTILLPSGLALSMVDEQQGLAEAI